jgi:hypothetical protein
MTTPTAALAASILPVVRPYRKLGLTLQLDAVCRFVRYGDLPAACDAAAYGIGWAIATGRVSGQVEQAITGLTPAKVAALVAEVATAGLVIGSVPRYLIDRFGN